MDFEELADEFTRGTHWAGAVIDRAMRATRQADADHDVVNAMFKAERYEEAIAYSDAHPALILPETRNLKHGWRWPDEPDPSVLAPSREEATALAVSDAPDGDHVIAHQPECACDPYGNGCTCTPDVHVVRRGKS